jgi:RimJ/RimL family protein N-acetyltransferase
VDVPHLDDGGVALRPWSLDDAQWYADCARDAEVQRFTSDRADLTAADVAAAIGRAGADPDSAAFLVADAVTGDRLGNIALGRAGGAGSLSYWVAPGARGRGVAGRAIALVTRWAFAELGLDVVRLWTHVDNAPSRAAAERAGFTRDPDGDRPREVKGGVWPTVAYELRAPGLG